MTTIDEYVARAAGINSPFGFEFDADPTLGFYDRSGKRYSLRAPAEWARNVLAAIAELTLLQKNWNSYGANQINTESIFCATGLANYLCRVDTVDEPVVTGTPDGNVAFAWDDGVHSLDLEIRRNGLIEYSFIHEKDESQTCEGSTRDIEEIAGYLAAF